MKSCWTCKYLCLLNLIYEPNPNFTYFSDGCCQFKSSNMVSYHPSGREDAILFDNRTAWNDGGIDSKYCEGYVEEE